MCNGSLQDRNLECETTEQYGPCRYAVEPEQLHPTGVLALFAALLRRVNYYMCTKVLSRIIEVFHLMWKTYTNYSLSSRGKEVKGEFPKAASAVAQRRKRRHSAVGEGSEVP